MSDFVQIPQRPAVAIIMNKTRKRSVINRYPLRVRVFCFAWEILCFAHLHFANTSLSISLTPPPPPPHPTHRPPPARLPPPTYFCLGFAPWPVTAKFTTPITTKQSKLHCWSCSVLLSRLLLHMGSASLMPSYQLDTQQQQQLPPTPCWCILLCSGGSCSTQRQCPGSLPPTVWPWSPSVASCCPRMALDLRSASRDG